MQTNKIDERLIRDLRNREATARRERRTGDADALVEYINRALAGSL